MKKIILGITLLFSISQADIYTRENIIMSPPYHSGFAERNIYNNRIIYHPNRHKIRHHRNHRNRRTANILIGGLLGGIIGNQLDRGRGPGAISGIIIGTIAGSSLSHHRRHPRYSYYEPRDSRFERYMMHQKMRYLRHERRRRWRHHHSRYWRHHDGGNFSKKHIIIVREF